MASLKKLSMISGDAKMQAPEPKANNLISGSNSDEVITFIIKGIGETATSGNRNNYVHLVASECNRFGVGENDAINCLLNYQENDFPSSEIKKAVWSAYQRTEEYGTKKVFNLNLKQHGRKLGSSPSLDETQDENTKKEKPKENVILKASEFISDKYKEGDILMNDLNKKLLIKGVEEIEPLYIDLRKNSIGISKSDLYDLLKTDFAVHYNPVTKYFDEMRNKYTYDQVEGSIDHLCSFVKAKDQELFNSMLRKHMIRAVGQGMAEFTNRFVFVIQQLKQNTGKSSFIRFLNPFSTGDLYAEKVSEKDPILPLSQMLMINLDELESFTKKDVNWLKSVISLQSDQIKVFYSQIYETRTRIASFWGSTNKIEFLEDGENSRWIILQVDDFDFDYCNKTSGVTKVDINKVWAEAIHLYHRKADMQPTAEEWSKLERINKEFTFQNDHDIWVEEFLAKSNDENDFTTLPVISEYLSYQNVRTSPQKIGIALTKAGYVKRRKFQGNGYLITANDGENMYDWLNKRNPQKFNDKEKPPF